MDFITLSDGIITGILCGDIDADLSNTDYAGHEKALVDNTYGILAGEPVSFYNENWVRKSEVQLIQEGLKELPEGYTINNGELKKLDMLKFIKDGELLEAYELPDGAELYNSDEWYMDDDGMYLKKDAKYELLMKKRELLSQLEQLDNSVTPRTMREAALGDKNALKRIKEKEDEAEVLRKKLNEMKVK